MTFRELASVGTEHVRDVSVDGRFGTEASQNLYLFWCVGNVVITTNYMRDLIVDIGGFLGKLSSVKPWIIRDNDQSPHEGEYSQTPAELDVYKQFSMCINCMLCYSACPVVGLEPEFTGPAAIALAQRYNLDSRDQGAAERLAILDEHEGMWGCTFVGECTKVCPKNVDPAGAIQLYKRASATEWFKSVPTTDRFRCGGGSGIVRT